MLGSLHVVNYATIEDLTVDFTDGLNVITGETGAGKSVLVGAISLALGARADRDAVRTGADKANVEAIFYDVGDEVVRAAREEGIDAGDEELIVRRELLAGGRSVARINGTPVNVGALRNLGALLLELHGQHDQQRLLDPASHIRLLDAFASQEMGELSESVASAWSDYREARVRAEELALKRKSLVDDIEMHRANLSALRAADLYAGVDEITEAKLKRLTNAEKLHEYAQSAYSEIYYASGSASEMLSKAALHLEKGLALDESLMDSTRLLEEAAINLDELSSSLRNYLDALEFDPSEVDELRGRLATINSLKRRYNRDVAGLLEFRDELAELVDLAENGEIETVRAREEADQARDAYVALSAKIGNVRKQAARRLEEAVTRALTELAMPDARFIVDFRPIPVERGNASGLDAVEFLVVANRGEEALSLAGTASGGEISRLALAIRSVLSDERETSCLVFDEIDAGIGGRTADSVAEKMAHIANSRQVICISHLAAIAAMADSHHVIEKTVADDERTRTSIRTLLDDDRPKELARMIGGDETSATSHATALLERAKKTRAES